MKTQTNLIRSSAAFVGTRIMRLGLRTGLLLSFAIGVLCLGGCQNEGASSRSDSATQGPLPAAGRTQREMSPLSGEASEPARGKSGIANSALPGFPVLLPGDDFDGAPCEIRLSEEWYEKWKDSLKKFRVKNPANIKNENIIRAYVKLFYKKNGDEIEYYKSVPVEYAQLKKLFTLEREYEKSIYVGTKLYYTGKMTYNQVKGYIHPKSHFGATSESLKNEENFNDRIAKYKNTKQSGNFTVLAMIRVDIEGENYLFFVYSYPLTRPEWKGRAFYLCGTCSWESGRWKYLDVSPQIHNIYPDTLFSNAIEEVVQKKKNSITFRFLKD